MNGAHMYRGTVWVWHKIKPLALQVLRQQYIVEDIEMSFHKAYEV